MNLQQLGTEVHDPDSDIIVTTFGEYGYSMCWFRGLQEPICFQIFWSPCGRIIPIASQLVHLGRRDSPYRLRGLPV